MTERKLTKADIALKIERLMSLATGCGHSLKFGDPPQRRYDTRTGEMYFTEKGLALLECPEAKMRAIWELWEMAPHIAFLLNSELNAALQKGSRHDG